MARKPTGPGHNSDADDRLRSLVERIERLAEESKLLASDRRDIFREASSAGYDAKAMRALIAERKQEPTDIAQHLAVLDTYRRACGMDPIGL